MTRIVFDMQDENLKEEVARLVSMVDYPLRFERIMITETCKVDFIKGDAKEDLEILINSHSEITKNKHLFRGYFARFLFQLINDKEGLNKDIEENLNCPRINPHIQTFFADYRAAKSGFSKVMKQFFAEKTAMKVCSGAPVSKKEFVEYYLDYLVMKKVKDGEEMANLIMPVKPHGLDSLLTELEKLDYPFKLGDKNLVKLWNEALYNSKEN